MELALIICINVGNILCFIIGAKLGQSIKNNEKININPVKAIDNALLEHKEVKEKEAEDEYIKTIMSNIDNYDGTGIGQKKIPNK